MKHRSPRARQHNRQIPIALPGLRAPDHVLDERREKRVSVAECHGKIRRAALRSKWYKERACRDYDRDAKAHPTMTLRSDQEAHPGPGEACRRGEEPMVRRMPTECERDQYLCGASSKEQESWEVETAAREDGHGRDRHEQSADDAKRSV